jgi:cytochrome c biogenesis protein CcmG, thiol:disulfide interchange protein DsbE
MKRPERLQTTRPAMLALQAAAVLLVFGLIGIFAWRLVSEDQAAQLGDAVNDGERPAAPGFTLERLDREGTISLASLRGKTVVLNFWASWCEPCKEESQELESVWQEYRDRGVVVVGIDARDLLSEARKFAERYNLSYPLAYDGPGQTVGSYGVTGFPETWFVSPDGRLVGERIQGPVTEEQLRANIEEALGST